MHLIRRPIVRIVACWALLLGTATATAAGPLRPDHHTDGGFQNPLAQAPHGGLLGFLKARFFGGERWARYDPETYQVPTGHPDLLPDGAVSENARVTWIGHATVLIQHQGVNILTDPIFSRRAGPGGKLGPARISAAALDPETLPPLHAVVISHNHYDHLDLPSLRRIEAAGHSEPMYFVPIGHRRLLQGAGIAPERIRELDWWQSATVKSGPTPVTLTATPAQHFSGRGLLDRNRALWASWAIRWADFSVWFGGDTGYNAVQFREIGRRFDGFDLGIIPIGAYRPRSFMSGVHVDPAEAVALHRDVRARRSVAIHWGTFILSAEHPAEPPADLARSLQAAGLPADAFAAFAVGETRRYPAGRTAPLATLTPDSTLQP